MSNATSPKISAIFGKTVRVFLFCEDPQTISMLTSLWGPQEAQWDIFSRGRDLLETLFIDPPQMLICTASGSDMPGADIIRMVKAENVFRHICAVLLLTDEEVRSAIDWEFVEADDFLLLPLRDHVVRPRLDLVLRRSTRTLDANPLTRLAGNVSIIQAIERYSTMRLHFALAYADLDHFKSFNDKYGFLRGDEVLLMTARLIAACVTDIDAFPKFVGHIGGDDFVFILPPPLIEHACQKIIDAFDAIVPSFYDEVDRERGSILSTDRKGDMHNFPMLSMSIAVVINRGKEIHHGELSHVVGQLKTVAKAKAGSCYVVDRRKC